MNPGFRHLAVCLALMLPAGGDETPDFSDALEQLADLGLPDLGEGAVWTANVPREIAQSGVFGDWRFQQLAGNVTGRAWHLPENPGGFLLLGSPAIREAETVTPPDPEHAAPFTEDIDALIESVRNADPDDLVSPYDDSEAVGPLLVFAAQAHAAGHSDAASRLAEAVLTTSPDRVAAIDAAVSIFADHELAEVTNTFFNDHDWSAYHAGLKHLIEAYPRGWDTRLAAAMLMPALEARAEAEPIPAPSLEDHDLSRAARDMLASWTEPRPADEGPSPEEIAAERGIDLSRIPASHRKAFLDQLAAEAGGGFRPDQAGVWLLSLPGETAESTATGPVADVRALGMDALPALAAVTDDPTLTPFRNRGGSSSGGVTYYGGSGGESDARKAARLYQSMDRPLSRGEVAMRLLVPVLPGFDTDASQADPLNVRDTAMELWKTRRDSAPLELARFFLREGTESQRQQVATRLANSDDPEARSTFEHTMLEEADPVATAGLAAEYIRRHRHEAREFFDRYAERLRAALGDVSAEDMDYSVPHEIRNAGGVEAFLKPLAVAAGAGSVEKILREAAASEPGSEELASLAGSLEDVAMKELLDHFPGAISEARPAVKTALLNALATRTNNSDDEDRAPMSADAAERWRPLVESGDALERLGGNQWFANYHCATLGSAAALTLEFVHNPDAYRLTNNAVAVLDTPEDVPDLLRRRALARLDGETPPPFPSTDNLPEERREEIRNLAGDTEAAALPDAVRALDPDERSAWIAWWTELAENGGELPESLLALRTRITEHLEPPPNVVVDHDLLESLDLAPGDELEAAKIEEVKDYLIGLEDTRKGTFVMLAPSPLGLGLHATAFHFEDDVESPSHQLHRSFGYAFENAEGEPDAISFVSLQTTTQTFGFWSRTGDETAFLELQTSAAPDFEDAFETFLQQKSPALPTFIAAALTREDHTALTPDP